ncbi:hypothetical protein Leryth_024899 [Lithospermum erythrorhizon]|uniref:Uncharacterized protein n=1 Tax=Lithospermum erythrorhizon TaxID=34254 RepID=A0AAV3QFH0_LITER|nr:hypothetical protein Leryth_024899 [Lithospermum erythrorhizon]
MKNMYKKATVHPTTPPIISDLLCFLPAAIFTLTVALSPDDREVLAYLISCSSNDYANIMNMHTKKTKNSSINEHATCFKCCCFKCYMSFWVRWDSSPNRQLIHQIIDAYEDGLTQKGKKEKGKKERRKKGYRSSDDKVMVLSKELSPVKEEYGETNLVESYIGGGEVLEKGAIRKFVSFVGEKIWGLWN